MTAIEEVFQALDKYRRSVLRSATYVMETLATFSGYTVNGRRN